MYKVSDFIIINNNNAENIILIEEDKSYTNILAISLSTYIRFSVLNKC